MQPLHTADMKKAAITFSWQDAVNDLVALPTQPYAQLRDQLKTGDLVLFSGYSLSARLVRIFTASRWSHIGIVVRLPHMPETPLLWEATRASKVTDINHGKPFDGVQLVSLDDRIATYQGQIAVRRLQGVPSDAESRTCLDRLIESWREKPYRNFVWQHLSVWLHGEESLSFQRGGFCSELVAEVYRQWRLLPTERPARNYVPRDFAGEQEISLLRGVLTPACLLSV